MQPQSLGDAVRQIGALRVVRANRLLQVRETRPVLDMEQRPIGQRPRHQIPAACELVVLVRLVDRDPETEALQPACLDVAHPGVDRVGLSGGGRYGPAGIDELEFGTQAESDTDPRV